MQRGFYYLSLPYICADYNWAMLLVELIIVFFELQYKDEKLEYNFKKDFILGILARSSDFIKTNDRNNFCNLFCFL